MNFVSRLSRRAKVLAGVFVASIAIGATQSEQKPTTNVTTSQAGLAGGAADDQLPRATTTRRPATTTTEVTAAPVTSTTEYVPPTTRYVPATTRYVAPPPEPSGGNCHPSYDPCIAPTGGDVDCAGGSGNGPRYVEGPVTVHGNDEYDLDRDGDGVGCES